MTDMLERAGRKMARPEPTNPGCTARLHGTAHARRKLGCHCPDAEAAYRAYRQRRNAAYRLPAEQVALARSAAGRASQAKRRDQMEPWIRWRGPRTRVDALTVDFLIAGYRFIGTPTRREFQVAVWRMIARHCAIPEIAEIIGVPPKQVEQMRKDRLNLRTQRTNRRLADAKRRAQVKHGQRW